MNSCKEVIKRHLLAILTLTTVFLAIIVGIGIRAIRTQDGHYNEFDKRTLMYIGFVGELFLRCLKGLILPLVFSSLVSAIGNLDTALSGRIAARAVLFYLVTTFLSVLLGIAMVVSIQPGASGTESEDTPLTEGTKRIFTTVDTILDLFRNMFPSNLIEACTKTYQTTLTNPLRNKNNDSIHKVEIPPLVETWKIGQEMTDSTNLLGIIVFAVFLGISLNRLGRAGSALLDVLTSLSLAQMAIAKAIIWVSPIGVFFLVLNKILEVDDFSKTGKALGLYSATVLAGIFFHGLILLPTIYFVMTRKNPFKLMLNLSQALVTAFATASSAATLPVTFSCLEDKAGIDRRISRFCLPIGASINMDGTALYEAVAAIFIAQMRGVPLDAGRYVSISITATAASIGAAGIPQAGLVTLVMVLNAVGLPPEDVSLILMVDWLLDRFRTVLNVLGDSTGAAIVAHLSEKDLHRLEDIPLEALESKTVSLDAVFESGRYPMELAAIE